MLDLWGDEYVNFFFICFNLVFIVVVIGESFIIYKIGMFLYF